jgi:hypothetical protein
MTLRPILPIAVLLLAGVALGQTELKPPCEYTNELLRKPDGKIVLFTSDEMKARATYKQDIGGLIKQADIKGTAIVDVLVAPSGHVICMKSLTRHPMIRKSVEDALRNWRFSPADVGGKKVAYVGRLIFTLCNISCAEADMMTIVK